MGFVLLLVFHLTLGEKKWAKWLQDQLIPVTQKKDAIILNGNIWLVPSFSNQEGILLDDKYKVPEWTADSYLKNGIAFMYFYLLSAQVQCLQMLFWGP